MEITIFQRMNFQLFLLLDSWSVDPWFVFFFVPLILLHSKKRNKPWDPASLVVIPRYFQWSVRYRTFVWTLFQKKTGECSQSCTKSVFFALLAIWYDTSTLWITTSLPMIGNWMFSLIFRLGKLQEATLWRVGCRDRLTSSPTAAVTFRGVLFHRTLRRQGKTATWYYVCTRFFS